ncbi:putative cysteine--tRNA ligase, mitochondrial [Acipenser ruthenus]|uniref:Putative cysteine--tRNA ligase, mitochondrial n=1 Tax=Acipenser ruthenus TaxID=7906 RepID=A0A662Z172_ACIRT|nr:putative cysteine--tRNA ligase, mitochondrial [Acipenser ruthenus]
MVITDIDDKIIKRASEVLPPTVYMRVTENIPPIIAFIEDIINNQHAYATPKVGSVYFDIKSIGRQYGKLMGWFVDSGGELGDTGDTDKRNARDFALWKASKPQEPFWEAPWGKGRPGWHIEYSTVARMFCHLTKHRSGMVISLIMQYDYSIKHVVLLFFVKLYFYIPAIDYSMNEAKSVLSFILAFFNNAGAYMTGKLLCQSVDEGFLWERVAAAKVNVQTVLTDDFDTPRAVDAIMGLIHHGNQQLQAVTKVTFQDNKSSEMAAVHLH